MYEAGLSGTHVSVEAADVSMTTDRFRDGGNVSEILDAGEECS